MPTTAASKRSQDRSKYSVAYLDETVTLQTDQAQRVMHRGFGRVHRALFVLDVILRVTQYKLPSFKEQYDAAIEHAVKMMDDSGRKLQSERKRLEHLLDKNGVTVHARYRYARSAQYTISTPQQARFIGLILQLDQVCQLLDTLWLNGVITTHAATETKYSSQRYLFNIVQQLVRFTIHARKAVRRAGAEANLVEALGEGASLTGEDVDLVEDGLANATAPEAEPALQTPIVEATPLPYESPAVEAVDEAVNATPAAA